MATTMAWAQQQQPPLAHQNNSPINPQQQQNGPWQPPPQQQPLTTDGSSDLYGQHDFNDRLEKLQLQTNEMVMAIEDMVQRKESWHILVQEYQRLTHCINLQQNVQQREQMVKMKDENHQVLMREYNSLQGGRTAWLAKYQEQLNMEVLLQSQVFDELSKWRREQQLAGNSGKLPGEETLNQIQSWCEILADVLTTLMTQLNKFTSLSLQEKEIQQIKDLCSPLYDSTCRQLITLVSQSFVIEKQPPQVMKTNTRFSSTVRLLAGGRCTLQMTPPAVKVSIISEQQAFTFIRAKNQGLDPMPESSGDILNNTGILEVSPNTRHLAVNFRNMQLKKIKRAEKKGSESVMDEKFALLFQSVIKIGGELQVSVWTLSLPVVVIVHGNQEPHAWATVTWDNAFAAPNRDPFRVPDKMPWPSVAEVLSMKFRSMVGRNLTPDALAFLAQKAFRSPAETNFEHKELSWALFAKEPLPDRSFTFWEWFYAILKVTREHMKSLWQEGTIIGFISRKQTEDLLLKRPIGTFLLRFSDSELGGLTIAWVGESADGTPEVFMVQPFTSRDFAIRGLPDRVNDLKNLVYLYPEIPKDHIFSKFYTRVNDQPPQSNGYVKPWLALTLPGSCGSTIGDYPNTPPSAMSAFNPHSPESVSGGYADPGSVPSTMNATSDYMSASYPSSAYSP